MTPKRYQVEAETAAGKWGVDPALILALVLRQSGGNADHFQFERKAWNRGLRSQYPGANPRRISSFYGLLALFYPTTQKDGFEHSPEYLFLPEINLEWGCKRLRNLLQWSQGFEVSESVRLTSALAAFRTGTGGNAPTDSPPRDEWFARQVLEIWDALEKESNASELQSVQEGGFDLDEQQPV